MKKSTVEYTVNVQRKDQSLKKVLVQDSFTIGRSLDCDLPLNDNSISRVHIVVSRRWQQIWIEDKNSSNGTFLNGTKIAQGVPVSIVPTDKIQVGKSEYYISISLQVDEEAEVSSNSQSLTIPVEQVVGNDHAGTDFKEMPVRQDLPFPKIRIENESLEPAAQQPPVAVSIHSNSKINIEEPSLSIEPAVNLAVPKVPNPEPVSQVQGQAAFQAEKILHDAKKKAAQIVYDGELQAEKRVQSIYQKAQEAQAQAETFYNNRIAEAHRQADAVLNDYQQQGQEMLREARAMAQELREEVDVFAQTMRSRSQKEAEHILSDARERADQLKNEILENSRKKAEAEANLLLQKAKDECQELIQFATMQTEDSRKQKAENDVVLEKLKAEVQAMKDEHAAVTKQTAEEYASLKKQVEDDHAALKKKTEEEYLDLNSNLKSKHEELVKKLNDEHRELTAKIHEEHAVLTQKVKAEQETQAQQMKEELTALQKKLAETQSQESAIRAQLSTESHELESVRSELALKQDQKRILEEQTKGIQEQIAKFTSDHRSFEEKKNLIVQEYETQKRHLKDKLENEKTRLLKETEETSQHMKLEMNKRIQKLEQDLLDDLITKKESLGKELLNAVEARVVKSLDAGKWGQMSSQVYSDIKEVIEGKVITLSQSTVGTNKKPVDLAKKKRNESLRWISAGMAAGALLFFISSTAYHAMVNDQAPVQSRLDEENRRRQEDLAKRKFNPPQVPEVKDSYVDAVIYTQDYVKVYLDPEFQKKLYKAASAYLLKTWRVDEDQSIQVLSAAGALVKELAEKKEAIHPDFVKDGVDKMHQLEAETIARMKEILGSEVRLESFRRFERRFVTEEGRQVASTPPAQE